MRHKNHRYSELPTDPNALPTVDEHYEEEQLAENSDDTMRPMLTTSSVEQRRTFSSSSPSSSLPSLTTSALLGLSLFLTFLLYSSTQHSSLSPALPSTPVPYPAQLSMLRLLDTASSPLPALCLGHDYLGRFGNNLFQLMFLLTMSVKHGLRPYVHRDFMLYNQLVASMFFPGGQPCPVNVWLNDNDRFDPPVRVIREHSSLSWGAWEAEPPNANRSITGAGNPAYFLVKYDGFFQMPAWGYDKAAVQALLRPRPSLEAKLVQLWYALLAGIPDDVVIMGVHIRRGDYSEDDTSAFRRLPASWYYDLSDRLQRDGTVLRDAHRKQRAERERLAQTALPQIPTTTRFCVDAAHPPGPVPRVCMLLVSDDIGTAAEVRADGRLVVTPDDVTKDLKHVLELVLGLEEVRSVYKDWYFMSRPLIVAISHSSFSYTATMFSDHDDQAYFFRPNGTTRTLVPYRPWKDHFYSLLAVPFLQPPLKPQ